MRISVNGRDINVEGETASYESIVSLAGMTGYPSMTYRWRDRKRRSARRHPTQRRRDSVGRRHAFQRGAHVTTR